MTPEEKERFKLWKTALWDTFGDAIAELDDDLVMIKIPFRAQGKSYIPIKIGRRMAVVPDKKTAEFEKYVEKLANKCAPAEPWPGAVEVNITYYFKVTEGWNAEKKASAIRGSVFATVKPDGDNVSKAICDAMSKVIFQDDAQIVKYSISKEYSNRDAILITVRELEHIPTQPRLI